MWLTGPLCRLCNVSDGSRYYEDSECRLCEASLSKFTVLMVLLATLIPAAALCTRYRHIAIKRSAMLKLVSMWIARVSAQLALRTKLKVSAASRHNPPNPLSSFPHSAADSYVCNRVQQFVGFYQIVTRLPEVYSVQLPTDVASLLSRFNIFSFSLALGVPLNASVFTASTRSFGSACYSLCPLPSCSSPSALCRGQRQEQPGSSELVTCKKAQKSSHPHLKKSVNLVGAPDPSAMPLLKRQSRSYHVMDDDESRTSLLRQRLGGGLVRALPWVLLLSFLTFPMVSSLAFRAFSCETFDGGKRFLRADYAVDCDSDEYTSIKGNAMLGILLYPILMPLSYMMLLERRALLSSPRGRPSFLALSHSSTVITTRGSRRTSGS